MPKKLYLRAYLDELGARDKNDLACSIKETADGFTRSNLDSFSFVDHEIGLLFGNIQAGKTAHMFGILCAAADASFPLFILLTTDSVALQDQTYRRVVKDLSSCGFCICNESDKQKFLENALESPAIVVLKKNSKVLLQWYNTLASSSFVRGNALFIIDDEADAASPNTLVNSKRVSTINTRLRNLRNASIGSIYLQVTGTPQALLLQSSASDFHPSFTFYFKPGSGYLGGDFFFDSKNKCAVFTDDYKNDSIKNGIYYAFIHHLVVSAQLMLNDSPVCNFVVHPSVRKASHESAKKAVEDIQEYLSAKIDEESVFSDFLNEYKTIHPVNTEKKPFDSIIQLIKKLLSEDLIKVLIMNSDTSIKEEDYNSGCNVIIGGNVLGRGVTFPKLQTLYYTRSAKKPQADTMWQHSRMFGYDRDPGLMAVYLTKQLYKLFADINGGNNSIISQVERGMEKIQIFYPEGLSPTRKNVIDMKMVNLVAGGTNYYPNDPDNKNIDQLNTMLDAFDSEGYYQIGARIALALLNYIVPSEDFNLIAFESVIKAMLAENPAEQCVLIVRRGREVTQGTGSLLSPNDRQLGDQFKNKTVITLYRVEGELGWKRDPIWVPNIKLPEFINYYDVQ